MEDNSGCSGLFGFLIIIVIIALITKPSESDILEQFDEKCPGYLLDNYGGESISNDLFTQLGTSTLAGLGCELLKPFLTTNDLYVFQSVNLGEKVIGIGIFSRLFILPTWETENKEVTEEVPLEKGVYIHEEGDMEDTYESEEVIEEEYIEETYESEEAIEEEYIEETYESEEVIEEETSPTHEYNKIETIRDKIEKMRNDGYSEREIRKKLGLTRNRWKRLSDYLKNN